MTSQPEAALTEAQAAYAAAKAERLERSTASNEAWCIALNFERLSAERLIALQAARIASLERENAAAVGKLERVKQIILAHNYPFYEWWKAVYEVMGVLELIPPEPAAAQTPADESGVTE